MWLKENRDNFQKIICKIVVAKPNKLNLIEMKVKYSRFRLHAKLGRISADHVADGTTTALRDGSLEKLWGGEGNFRAAEIFVWISVF